MTFGSGRILADGLSSKTPIFTGGNDQKDERSHMRWMYIQEQDIQERGKVRRRIDLSKFDGSDIKTNRQGNRWGRSIFRGIYGEIHERVSEYNV